MKSKILTFSLLMLLASCQDSNDGDNNEDSTNEQPEYSGGGMPSIEERCGEIEWESVEWEDTLENGKTPAELFGELEGECTAPMIWDATTFDMSTIAPKTGESDMSVAVTFDHALVKVGKYNGEGTIDSNGGDYISCEELMVEVPVSVQLSTADGMFDESADTFLRVYEDPQYNGSYVSISFDKELGTQGGDLAIDPGDVASATLQYHLTGATAQCAGHVELMYTEHGSENGDSSAGVGQLGTWSATNCPMGQSEVDIMTTLPDGSTIADMLTKRFGDVNFTGQWTDGSETTLNIQVEADVEVACRQSFGVQFPVTVTYSTTDGIIEQTSVQGNAEVNFDANDNLRDSMGLWMSHDISCSDEADSIAYTANDCATIFGVTIQLGINTSGDTYDFSDEAMIIYVYHRDGDGFDGAADENNSLILSTGN